MTNQRVAILDGSSSLYPSPNSVKPPSESNSNSMPGLQPIPQFREIVTEVVKTALAAGDVQPGKIARVDMGVVCECTAVRRLAKAMHARVAEVLIAAANSKTPRPS